MKNKLKKISKYKECPMYDQLKNKIKLPCLTSFIYFTCQISIP